jgi:hypothetical protein
MNSVLKWILGVGVIWFVVTLGLTAYLAWIQASSHATTVNEQVVSGVLSNVMGWGSALGHFIAPVVQIALIVMILIVAAERFGFTGDQRHWAALPRSAPRTTSRPSLLLRSSAAWSLACSEASLTVTP